MIVRTILAVRALGIVEKNGDAVLRRSTTSENLVTGGRDRERLESGGDVTARCEERTPAMVVRVT